MIANEILFGAIFMLISVFCFCMTLRFPDLRIALSPTVFPRFVTVSLFILSSFLLAQGIKKQVRSRGGSQKIRIDRAYIIRFIMLGVTGFIYTRIIRFTGYIIATPLLIAGSMLIFNERKWYRIILVSVVTTAILYSVFRMFFRVPLPRFSLW
ncbi:MAG: tripartite tricarboxylate transporter TctB family protein [Spirochaetota bacterium]|nr:MAG: tripartite tricarboxylate transporter TctB family protein [Spirochaetota bacterium]